MLAEVQGMPLKRIAGVDFLAKALELLMNMEEERLPELTPKDFGVTEWSDSDLARLDVAARDVGDDIDEIHKILPKKSRGDLVKQFYLRAGYV